MTDLMLGINMEIKCDVKYKPVEPKPDELKDPTDYWEDPGFLRIVTKQLF